MHGDVWHCNLRSCVAGVWQYEVGTEALRAAAPLLRAQLDAACASALRAALTSAEVPDDQHQPLLQRALAADGAQVRHITELAPHLSSADAPALAQAARLPVEVALPALIETLEQAARRAALAEWAAAAGGAHKSAAVAAARGAAEAARRRTALRRLAADLQQALRATTETAECAAQVAGSPMPDRRSRMVQLQSLTCMHSLYECVY